VLSVRTWRLADLGAKHALLVAGMGWGNMPKPMVNEDLKRGRLVELNVEMPGEPVYPFHTVYRNDAPPGPAASWLMERLASG
jgi:DNA-binding transcriptional LysR family regulator